MVQALRDFMATFKMAGVESQTVERVLEQFGGFFYDLIASGESKSDLLFSDKKEASDFAYLLIMLHTCKHNKNLEDKSDLNWFKKSTKDLCPKTFELYEEDMKNRKCDPLQEMFHFIEA